MRTSKLFVVYIEQRLVALTGMRASTHRITRHVKDYPLAMPALEHPIDDVVPSERS